MASSDTGEVALRLSALLVLAAITLGLLVWYGTVSRGAALVARSAASTLGAAPFATAAAVAPAVAGAPAAATAAGATVVPGEIAAVASDAVALSARREPWEAHYMYGVSALAGCWVLARLASQWRLDLRTLALVPRGKDRPASPAATRVPSDEVDDANVADEPARRPVADGGRTRGGSRDA